MCWLGSDPIVCLQYPRRRIEDWRPAPLLCKRFGVADPYMGKAAAELPGSRFKSDFVALPDTEAALAAQAAEVRAPCCKRRLGISGILARTWLGFVLLFVRSMAGVWGLTCTCMLAASATLGGQQARAWLEQHVLGSFLYQLDQCVA